MTVRALRRIVVVAGAAVATIVTPVRARQDVRPSFRATTDAVSVDVSVQRSGRPVANLTAADFELRDEGVVQTITDISYEKMPIDVTIAFDVSLSVTDMVLTQLRHAVDDVRARLRPGDRIKLMTFNMRVSRVLDFTDRLADTKGAFDRVTPAGSTALLDAVAVALTSAAPIDRRQLIIALGDGQDTSSVTGEGALREVARRTTGTVVFVLPSVMMRALPVMSPMAPPAASAGQVTIANGVTSTGMGLTQLVPPALRTIAAETGGLVVPAVGDAISSTLTRTFDNFRSTYVLHYSPSGVRASGFHELHVRVTRRGNYDVRARRGYQN
jgi:VWFA-related protein